MWATPPKPLPLQLRRPPPFLTRRRGRPSRISASQDPVTAVSRRPSSSPSATAGPRRGASSCASSRRPTPRPAPSRAAPPASPPSPGRPPPASTSTWASPAPGPTALSSSARCSTSRTASRSPSPSPVTTARGPSRRAAPTRSTASASSGRCTRRGAAGSRAGRRCRCSGTSSAARWCATRASRSPSSSAASRRKAASICGRRSCARTLNAGTASSIPASTTACTGRCGFAQSQAAYDAAASELFAALDRLEAHLAGSRYLCGDRLTLADVCLFTTLIRFDAVYNPLFRCTRRKLAEYPSLHAFTRDIYQMPRVAETCDMEAIMEGYFKTLFPLNPGGIQPLAPASCDRQTLLRPHGREALSSAGRQIQAATS